MDTTSDSLLTEILGVVQQLAESVEEFKVRLESLENEVHELKNSIEGIVNQGFKDADLVQHKRWHERSWLGKIFFK